MHAHRTLRGNNDGDKRIELSLKSVYIEMLSNDMSQESLIFIIGNSLIHHTILSSYVIFLHKEYFTIQMIH